MTQEKKPSQSQSFNNSNFSNVQIGQGEHIHQVQTISEAGSGKSFNPEEIIKLIEKMQHILQGLELANDIKSKCSRHLQTVKDEVHEEKPDKEYAARTLQKFNHILKETGNTLGSGMKFMDKLQPVMTGITPWLGEAQKFLVL